MSEPSHGPKTAVIGFPIDHSRSPIIHGHWLREYEIAGSYEALEVSPDEADGFFSSFLSGSYEGANVTIPHKESVLVHLNEVDEAARQIGAVNTIYRKDGKLCGTNTDWLGFLANLDDFAPGWSDGAKIALVIGAGGASKAIVYALKDRGFQKIHVANRTITRAQAFKDIFGDAVTAHEIASAQSLVPMADLIVNTTSLGMKGSEPLNLTLQSAKPTCVVTDIVYAPLETPLLEEARRHSLRTVDGLGMLLHQAAPGFALWFGVKPEVTEELRQEVLRDLGKAS